MSANLVAIAGVQFFKFDKVLIQVDKITFVDVDNKTHGRDVVEILTTDGRMNMVSRKDWEELMAGVMEKQ